MPASVSTPSHTGDQRLLARQADRVFLCVRVFGVSLSSLDAFSALVSLAPGNLKLVLCRSFLAWASAAASHLRESLGSLFLSKT